MPLAEQQIDLLQNLPDAPYAIVRDASLIVRCRELVGHGLAAETRVGEFDPIEGKLHFLSAFRRTAKGRKSLPETLK